MATIAIDVEMVQREPLSLTYPHFSNRLLGFAAHRSRPGSVSGSPGLGNSEAFYPPWRRPNLIANRVPLMKDASDPAQSETVTSFKVPRFYYEQVRLLANQYPLRAHFALWNRGEPSRRACSNPL